jgi:hypothetical protein
MRIYKTEPVRERFLRFVEQCPETGCWLWRGAVFGGTGYAQLSSRRGQRPYAGHRLAYELFVGPIPEGLFVCHKCDVRRCVNPAHLFLGTPLDNSIDAAKKGRTRGAKLSVEQLSAIAESTLGIRALSRKYGISRPRIRALKKRWQEEEKQKALAS